VNSRPYVLLSCAISIDGYIVCAGCDAILVGATTIRKETPRLLVRSQGPPGRTQSAMDHPNPSQGHHHRERRPRPCRHVLRRERYRQDRLRRLTRAGQDPRKVGALIGVVDADDPAARPGRLAARTRSPGSQTRRVTDRSAAPPGEIPLTAAARSRAPHHPCHRVLSPIDPPWQAPDDQTPLTSWFWPTAGSATCSAEGYPYSCRCTPEARSSRLLDTNYSFELEVSCF